MYTPIDVRIIDNLSPTDWWSNGITAAATIIGAIVGGVSAYIIARQTAKESRQASADIRRQAEETATFRAGLKLMELVNAVAGYHHGAENEIEQTKRRLGNDQIDTWQVMRGFSGQPQEISINSDDLVAFVRARKFSYVSEVFHLLSRYNAMIYSADDYSKRRGELLARFTPTQMSGVLGTVEMDERERRQLAPHIMVVSDLAKQLRSEMKEIYELSLRASKDFGPIVREYFNDARFPIPEVISENRPDRSGNS